MNSLTADLVAAFVAGVLGSLHCIGMCGPLAAMGCRAGFVSRVAAGPLLFSGGKLAGYAVLGLLAGFAGAALTGGSAVGRAAAYASIIGGGLMLVVLALGRLRIASGGAAGLSVALAKLSFKAGNQAPLFLGMAAALLPCGLLYAMVARSAAAGQPTHSMALMVAFGLGTSPALLGIGTLLRAVPQKWSRWGTALGEVVLALTAGVLIWRGWVGLTASVAHSCCH